MTAPIANLVAALVEAKKEMPAVRKTATNPHFNNKFVPLDEIVEKITPVLGKHGLAWATFPTVDSEGRPALRYRLLHTSGEQLEDVMPLCIGDKVTPQAQGSALSYGRRYAVQAVLDLAGNDDDDGNKGSEHETPARGRRNGGAARMADSDREGFYAELEQVQGAAMLLAAAGVSTKPSEWLASDAPKIRAALDERLAVTLAGGLDGTVER